MKTRDKILLATVMGLGLVAASLAAESERDVRHRELVEFQQSGDHAAMAAAARDWIKVDGENPLPYEYLGLSAEGRGDASAVLRAFTSLVDLGPQEAELLGRAGYLALRANRPDLAEGYLSRASTERPDRANYARGLALAQWMNRRHEKAARTLIGVIERRFPSRYGTLKAVLREEAHAILEAWEATGFAPPATLKELRAKVGPRKGPTPDLRVSMHWESEADDVDLVMTDPAGKECSFRNRRTRSGLHLYADVSQGLGPEVMAVPRGKMRKGTYQVKVRDYRPGPTGVVRGMVVVQRMSDDGGARVEVTPFTLVPPVDRSLEPELVGVTRVVVDG